MPCSSIFGEIRADELDLAVLDLIHLVHHQVFEGTAVLAAEFDPHVGLADDLAFEGRAIRHRYGNFAHLDFDAAHLDAFLHQALGAFHVVCAFDLVEGHRDDMLVRCDASGQDLGDDRIGDDREAKVDGAGSGGIFQVIDLAQCQHEGEDAVLVVEQDVACLAALDAAEGERRS